MGLSSQWRDELFVEMHFTHRANADRNRTDICTPEETAHRETMYMPCLSYDQWWVLLDAILYRRLQYSKSTNNQKIRACGAFKNSDPPGRPP